VTVERTKPKSILRRIERWMVGLVMAVIAFVLEKMVMRGIKKGAKAKGEGKEELHTTLTSKGGEVDLEDVR
jgi:hypothetical protein